MGEITVKEKPLRQVKDVRELLANDAAKKQLASIAAKHLSPERMMKVVANALRVTPKLAECEPMSLLGALMTCAWLGLEPNTPLGHAYLIPFANKKKGIVEVQLIIGYKGYIDLARRSGNVSSIHADVVYDDDELWSYEYGTNLHLRHKPGPRKGEKTHAYCHVKLKDGQAFVVLPWAEYIKTRDNSQGWQSAVRFGKTADSPHTTHEDRMAAKTAVRRMANSGEMPLSLEFMAAIEVDESRADFGAFALSPDETGPVIDGESEEIEEEKPAEEPKPDPKPEAKKTDPKPKEEPKAEAMPPHLQSLLERIVGDLTDATQPDHIDAILAMFEVEIGNGKAESAAFAKEIDEQIAEFRKAVA